MKAISTQHESLTESTYQSVDGRMALLKVIPQSTMTYGVALKCGYRRLSLAQFPNGGAGYFHNRLLSLTTVSRVVEVCNS